MPDPDPATSIQVEGAEDPRREVAGLARGGLLNLVGNGFSQVVFFLLTIVVARRLGKSDAGVYFVAYALLSLLELLSLSGFRAGLTRFVSVNLAEGDRNAMRGTVRIGLGASGPSSVLLAVALAAAAPWLADEVFKDPDLLLPLRYVALALPATSFTSAALSATQGFRTMRAYVVVGMVVEPGVRFTLTLVLIELGMGLRGAMIGLTVSSWIGALLAAIWLKHLMGRPSGRPKYQVRRLFSFSAVSWLASLASTGLIWADTVLLGIYLPSDQIGLYNSATRLVNLATFVMVPITASFAPRIAHLYACGQLSSVQRTYVAATGWIVRLSVPAFVVLLLFPREALTLAFGKPFAVAASVTAILAVGKLVDAATGPCGLILNMSGRVHLSMFDNIGVLVLNIVLNIFLIPRYGIVGSAGAWAFSLVVVNLVRVWQVASAMAVLPFGAGCLKGVLAGVVAAAAGLIVRTVLDGQSVLFVGTLAILVVYPVVLLLLGLTDDDRVVTEDLLRRHRRRGNTALAGEPTPDQSVSPLVEAPDADGPERDRGTSPAERAGGTPPSGVPQQWRR